MSSITIDPLLGRQLANKFEIRELLGVGAMGKVYRAHHEGLDKPVAIKVLITVPAIAEAQARRFKAEARAASRLEHPNSVQILDFGEEQDGLLYIVMEYLQGIDLQDLISKQGTLPTQRTAWIMSQVFSALGAAHSSGVIHRDIKPGNVMLVDKSSEDGTIRDFVKVCDFGLAKILDAGANMTGGPLTAQGAVFGTPAYMSPEQALGDPLDARSDIYSCGVLMYKMLVGHTPFRAETPTGVLMGHINETPPSIHSWGLKVHDGLAAIVERAMQKDPKDRFQNARDARDALRRLLDEEGLSKPPLTSASALPVRISTRVPTEQVRLRNDEAATQAELEATLLERPAEANEATQYADTMSAEKLAAARADVAATRLSMPTPTVPTPSAPPPQAMARRHTWWALVPGGLALVVALLLFVVLVLRAPPPSPDPSPPAPNRADPPKTPAAMPTMEPGEPTDPALSGPAPDAPDMAPPSDMAPDGVQGARTPASPASDSAPSMMEKSPAPAEPLANPTQQPTAPSQRGTTPERPGALALGAGPKPDLEPTLPSADPRASRLVLTLAAVRVQGALSRQRCQDALTRHLERATTCLSPLVGTTNMRMAGEIKVKADVDAKGRLRNIESTGLKGATECMTTSFASARLPEDDMGAAKVYFSLRYHTVSP